MTPEQHKEANALEYRISQLTFFKSFMQSFENDELFSVEIKTKVLGEYITHQFPFVSNSFTKKHQYHINTSDIQFIIDTIDERIKSLEEKFSKI